jgi:hypothetical protein
MAGRLDNPSGSSQRHRSKLNQAELEHFKALVDAAPDIRMEKVMRIRRAIETNTYDETAMLERALARLEDELGDSAFADEVEE